MINPSLVDDIHSVVAARLDQEISTDPDMAELDHQDRRQLALSLINAELAERDGQAFAGSTSAFTEVQARELTESVMNQMFGLARIQYLSDADENSDIQINGYDNVWTQKVDGRKVRESPVAESDEQLIALIQAAARRARVERTWSETSPFLDMTLPNGSRLNAVAWVVTRPCITIRRHNWTLANMKAYFEAGGVSESLMWFLIAAIKGHVNIIVAGGTFTGKTTLARCMLNEVGPEDRILTVEDNLELRLSEFPDLHPNLIESEARKGNLDGQGEITMNQLVKNALRQSPDRIVIGEIRGAEVISMLQAMNVGHDGSIATIHASDSRSIVERLEICGLLAEEQLPVEAMRRLVGQNVHLFVQVARMASGRRCVTSVREVVGYDGNVVQTNEIYGQVEKNALAVPLMRPTEIGDQLEAGGFDSRWLDPANGGWD